MISVVVLNYRRADDTIGCVRSVLSQTGEEDEVVVVDNASGDGSLEKLSVLVREGAGRVHLLDAGRNGGFSAGNNVGIRHAIDRGADFVWMLNNDAELLPGAFAAMRAAAAADRCVGSVVREWDGGRVQTWGGGVLDLRTGINRNVQEPGRLDYLTGASFLFPAWLISCVGPWDEDFFLEWEDIEFSRRAVVAGLGLEVAPEAGIRHRGGATIGAHSPLDVLHRTRGCFLFYRKHHPALLPWILFLHLSKFGKAAWKRDPAYARSVIAGYLAFARTLP